MSLVFTVLLANLHHMFVAYECGGSLWSNHESSSINLIACALARINTTYSGAKKVFSQPPIVQVIPLKKMREACNFHHRYTSTMRDKIRKKNPENHIVGFLKNLFANYGGK